MEARKIPEHFSSLSGNVKHYIRLKIELYKLMAAEGVAQLISHIIISLVLFLLSIFLLFFLSMAFIYWYGEHVGQEYIGALIVVGFYLLASVMVYLFRYQLFINPLISRLTTLMKEEDSDEDQ
ncbi:MAG: phage holin family protein [Bacteroidota bacterium]